MENYALARERTGIIRKEKSGLQNLSIGRSGSEYIFGRSGL